MVRRVLALGITVTIGTMGLAACSSDSDALSAEDYRKQANKICADGNERLEEIAADLDENSTEDEIQAALEETLDDIESQIADIRGLEGPDDLESDVNDVLDDALESIDDLRDQVEEDPMSLLESEEDPFADINDRLTELDLEQCGES
jgi:uncharacterized protein YicC (UPF0701 family)